MREWSISISLSVLYHINVIDSHYFVVESRVAFKCRVPLAIVLIIAEAPVLDFTRDGLFALHSIPASGHSRLAGASWSNVTPTLVTHRVCCSDCNTL